MKKKYITGKKIDEKFDNDEDVLEYMDLENIEKPGLTIKRVSVDFPEWMIQLLDSEAKWLGVTLQSAIKLWISERLSNITA